jgi:hypothetical protein
MGDLTEKFGTLEGLLSDQNTAILTSLTAIADTLGLLNTALDTINNNGATNTRYILQALQALDPCACAGSPTLIVPPAITTPIDANPELCQRIQAFLHTVQELVTVLDAASAFSVGLNFSLITNSFNEVIAGIESGSGLPIISYPEAVNLVGAMINYIAGNLLVGDSLSSLYSGVLLDLRDGMVSGTDASSMQGLYDGVIDASSLPSYVKPVLKQVAYNALYNYYFDAGTSPDLTGYDGTLCGYATCVTLTATQNITYNGSGAYSLVIWPSPFNATNNGGFNDWGANVVCTDNMVGWTVTPTHNIRVYNICGLNSWVDVTAGSTYTMADTGCTFFFEPGNAAFSVELCPP